MFTVDALIIGGGPAGLSAALALSRVHRTCIVFTDGEHRNQYASEMHNLVSRDGSKLDRFLEISQEQIDTYHHATIVKGRIVSARSLAWLSRDKDMERSLFEVSDHLGNLWRGKKIIFAGGVQDQFPSIPGYEENWGANIYNCLFCEGHERSTGPAGILGFSTPYHLDNFFTLLNFGCSKIHVFLPAGLEDDSVGTPDPRAIAVAKAKGAIFHRGHINELENLGKDINNGGINVHFQSVTGNHEVVRLGFLWHPPKIRLRNRAILEQLGVEVDDDANLALRQPHPLGLTNITGVFVAGDAASGFRIVPAAIASGSLASVGVHSEILREEQADAYAQLYSHNRKVDPQGLVPKSASRL